MSEQTTETGAQPPESGPGTAPEGTGTPPEGTEGGNGGHGGHGGGQNGQESANQEAARYRTQLRAAEVQRDALASRVEALQRREIERMAAERLAVPSDVFDVGRTDLAALLGEDGDVDPAKVTAAVSRCSPRPRAGEVPLAGPGPEPAGARRCASRVERRHWQRLPPVGR